MWLFTIYGFYSVSVEGKTTSLRARLRKHLLALQERFPSLRKAEIIILPQRDYRYRIVVDNKVWHKVALELVKEQTWGNFKNQAAKVNGYDKYVSSLHAVWYEMFSLQEGEKQDEPRVHRESRPAGRQQPGLFGRNLRDVQGDGLEAGKDRRSRGKTAVR
jgi:hypothetical protein